MNRKYRGSLTLEAACVLPFFMFAILAVLSLSEMIRAYGDIESNLHRISKEIALYSYAGKELSDYAGIEGVPADLIATILSDGYTTSKMSELFTEANGQSTWVVDGGLSATSFITSSASFGNDYVDLAALYRVRPFCEFMGFKGFLLANRCYMHTWTGYGGGGGLSRDDAKPEDIIVYVAENGTVYHKTSSCTYINLSINSINASRIETTTNQSGNRYRACEYCNPEAAGTLYITNYGDCYHSSLGCSGLKRTVRAVPLSEVGGLPPCSKCGGSH